MFNEMTEIDFHQDTISMEKRTRSWQVNVSRNVHLLILKMLKQKTGN